jgi:hypothetical protein
MKVLELHCTAGQIGYALVPMIARGIMLGPDQPVILHMLDIPPAVESLNGVKMELQDAAFPLLKGSITPIALTSFSLCRSALLDKDLQTAANGNAVLQFSVFQICVSLELSLQFLILYNLSF